MYLRGLISAHGKNKVMKLHILKKSAPIFAFFLLIACESPGVNHPLADPLVNKSSVNISTLPIIISTETTCQKCNVSLKDFKIDPENIAVKSGEVSFVLNNGGRVTHAFTIEGVAKAPNIGAGKSLEWSTTLSPGEYVISCRISNHAERGMKGIIVVK